MNPDIQLLQSYPFEKLHALKGGAASKSTELPINLSLGEPQHPCPDFIHTVLQNHTAQVQKYPLTHGTSALREAIRSWLIKRYRLPEDSISADRNIVPVNGTREGLFSIAQAIIDRKQNPLILLPNPFYQIYEGAAILAGAEPHYYASDAKQEPDFDAIPTAVWKRCQLIYICTPGNPTGQVLSTDVLLKLIEKAEQYNFTIVSDECYSEIYFDDDQPPPGLLEAAALNGRSDYAHCLVFNSLSKRSNVPGLRSGFAAGDHRLIKPYLHYRTYHGCAMSGTVQQASIAAWQNETHVHKNRGLYKQKFKAVMDILSPVMEIEWPDAAFFLWPKTPIDDQQFTQALYNEQNVTVLPGSYLSRTVDQHNPGQNRVRIALVAGEQNCIEAAERIRKFLQSY